MKFSSESIFFLIVGVFGIVMGLLKTSRFYLGDMEWGKLPETNRERKNKKITSIIAGVISIAIGIFIISIENR